MSASPAAVRTEATPFREAGLLDPERGRAALSRAIPALGPGGWRLAEYRPLRFEVRDAVTLTGEAWLAPAGSAAPRRLAFEVAATQPEPGPWAGRDAESGLGFRLSPADQRLPLLGSALEVSPRSAEGLAESWRGRAELVAHRFGRRAMLRVQGPGSGPIWIKLWARDRGGRVADLHARLADAEGFRVAKVSHHDPRGRLAAFEPLDGTALHDLLDRIDPAGGPSVGSRLADTLRAISGIDPGDLPTWGLDEERDNLSGFVTRAARVSRDQAARIAARITAFERDEAPPTHDGHGLVHRDLHDKQLILGGGRPGVLDWDLAAGGPPALDAGNLLAHFTLRALQLPARAERIRPAAEEFVAAWGRKSDDGPALLWWTRITLLRLACVYTLRPGAEALADALLASVDAPLGLESRP